MNTKPEKFDYNPYQDDPDGYYEDGVYVGKEPPAEWPEHPEPKSNNYKHIFNALVALAVLATLAAIVIAAALFGR